MHWSLHKFYWPRHWFRHGLLGLCLLLLIGGIALLVARPASAQSDEFARVHGVLLPEPSLQVARGDVITYTLQATNIGNADAGLVLMTFSYNPFHLTLEGAQFANSKDWVSDRTSNDQFREQVTVRMLDLDQGETRPARLVMRVNADLPDGTVIQSWSDYTWIDASGDHSLRQSNSAPVLVGSSSFSSPYVWMDAMPPVAPLGEIRSFRSDRFLPGEEVIFWVNTPDGTHISLEKRARVDEFGFFLVHFTGNNWSLPPGDYQMVGTGNRSGLVGIANFTVTP